MPNDRSEVRALIIDAVMKRVRPCLLTSATTILALLPVLSATGSGADLMVPLAIPTVGGLSLVLLSMFIVPVLWSWRERAESFNDAELSLAKLTSEYYKPRLKMTR